VMVASICVAGAVSDEQIYTLTVGAKSISSTVNNDRYCATLTLEDRSECSTNEMIR